MITSLLVDYNNSVFKNNFYLKHVSNFLKFIFNINISKQSKNKKIIWNKKNLKKSNLFLVECRWMQIYKVRPGQDQDNGYCFKIKAIITLERVN